MERLAWHLECQLQAEEFFSAAELQQRHQIADLAKRVAFLEQLLAGTAAA